MYSRALLAVCMVFSLVVWADGQGFHPRAGRQPGAARFAPVRVDGAIAQIGPGMIMVTTAANEMWWLKVPANAVIRVTGTAEPEVLCSGLFVRFTAAVDKRRSKVQGKVEKLTIFTPSREPSRMPGVFYPNQVGAGAGVKQGPEMPPGFGMPPNPGMRPNPAVQPQVPGTQNASARGTAASNVEAFDIRAQVASHKKGKLTLYVPNPFFKPKLKIELSEEPVIEVDVSSYAVAKPGDKISARGLQISQRGVHAREVLIELAEPLDTLRKKPQKRTADN